MGIFDGVIRSREGNVEVSLTWASAVVHFDLRRRVGAVCRRQAACRGECRCVNPFAGARSVGQAAVIGALHIDVERCQVVVRDIGRGRVIDRVVPHAVIARN